MTNRASFGTVIRSCSAGLTAAVLLVGVASAQSLGDVARKEESRRKAVSGGKVYTNQSLPATEPAAPAAVPATPGAAAASPAPAGQTSSCPERPGIFLSRADACGEQGRGCEERRGVLAKAATNSARRSFARRVVRRSAAEPHQCALERLRESRRSGSAERHRQRSPESARGAGPCEEGNPAIHERRCRYAGGGAARRRSCGLGSIGSTGGTRAPITKSPDHQSPTILKSSIIDHR